MDHGESSPWSMCLYIQILRAKVMSGVKVGYTHDDTGIPVRHTLPQSRERNGC